jgi:endonuclease YncB( thermonuclease family)
MTMVGVLRVLAVVALVAVDAVGTAAMAEPVAPSDIEVIDGGTVRTRGKTVTLLGYDTPRRGPRALCRVENTMRAMATVKLRDLVAAGNLSLAIVPCPCGKLSRGTIFCNRGRACGVLRSGGQNVGDMLIREKLAREFICGETRCPPRKIARWCE